MTSSDGKLDCSLLPWHLYLLTLDDYSPHALVGGMASNGGLCQWQYSVEVIYRCLESGLWTLWDEEVLDFIGALGHKGLCEGLSRLNPAELDEEGERYWLVPLMTATESAKTIVEKFRIPDQPGQFGDGILDEVERHFAAAGVSIRRGLIFPIDMKQ